MIAKAVGSIDKTASFPEWQYNVTILNKFGARINRKQPMTSDILLMKLEFEAKFKLKELLESVFNVKIIKKEELISVQIQCAFLLLI